MSDFVFLFHSAESDYRDAMGTPERAQRSTQAWMAWMRDLEARGHLKNPGQPLERTGTVVSKKTTVVIDGPYAETKDLVLGFIVVEARDLDQAGELARECPMVIGGGAVE